MYGWIVFIKKSLRRGVRLGLVADRPQKAVQGIEPALIVIDEKDCEAPRASRPHNLTYLGNLTVLGLTVYRQTAVTAFLLGRISMCISAALNRVVAGKAREGLALERRPVFGMWCSPR
jgi:hypothetical protein